MIRASGLSLDIVYPDEQSRLLTLVKGLVIVPHAVVLVVLHALALAVTALMFPIILVLGRYPEPLFQFVLGVHRWTANVGAYLWGFSDEYPPFTGREGYYPLVHFSLEYVPRTSRVLDLMRLPMWVGYSIAAYYVLWWLWLIAANIGNMLVLVFGRYPRVVLAPATAAFRWWFHSQCFLYCLTDRAAPAPRWSTVGQMVRTGKRIETRAGAVVVPAPEGSAQPSASEAPAATPATQALRGSGKAFIRSLQNTEKMAATGKVGEAADRRLKAVRVLLSKASYDEILLVRDRLVDTFRDIIPYHPSEAFELLDDVSRIGKDVIKAPSVLSIARSALQQLPVSAVRETWPRIEALLWSALRSAPDETIRVVADATTVQDPGSFSQPFAVGLGRSLLLKLHSSMRLGARKKVTSGVSQLDLDLLTRLSIRGSEVTRGDVLCALGDMAASENPGSDEAIARYRAAVSAGSGNAPTRLAFHLARKACQLPQKGDLHTASTLLAEALSLDSQADYQMLFAALQVLQGLDPVGARLQLEALNGQANGGYLSLWLAYAAYAQGNAEEALRDLGACPWLQPNSPAEDQSAVTHARALRCYLAGDWPGLAQIAAECLSSAGDSWFATAPIDPTALLYAASRSNESLFLELLNALPDGVSLPGPLGFAGSTALLKRAAAAAAIGDHTAAESALTQANSMMGTD